MSEMLTALEAGLPLLGLDIDRTTAEKLCAFGAAVVEQNKVMNLTAITEPDAVAKLHLLDSLTVLKGMDLSGKKVIDVGCGAGFPGVPLKIACPTMKLTLLDSLGKRMKWLETILPELGVDANCVTARAEEAVASCRETYDVATSRAVARLPILLELCAPYVKVGGFVAAMKGTAMEQELDEAKNAISRLGLKLHKTLVFPIADTNHTLILLKKVKPTPAQYPRRYSKIKQSPL